MTLNPARLRKSARRSVVLVLALSVSIAACSSTVEPAEPKKPDSTQGSVNQAPPASVIIDEGPTPDQRPKTEVFTGTDDFLDQGLRKRAEGSREGDVSLDFADADVKEVVRTVFGDILQVPFSIDPQIQGKITLKTSKPLRRADAIAALETALKANGAVIVLADNVFNVVPAADATKRVDGFELSGSKRAKLPGYGIEIVPLRYIAAAEMKKVLEPVAPAGGVLTVDPSRNLVFLAGTAQERAAMLDTIRLFDVDHMKGMSYALIRPEHMDAPALAEELTRVFQNTSGANAALIRFVPLPRLNTLLVVSPRKSYLAEVTKWVERLDVTQVSPSRRIYFYRLQNAKAQDVARSLAAVYGNAVNGGENASAETPPDAPLPPLSGSAAEASQPAPSAPPYSGNMRAAAAGNGNGPQISVDEANNALVIRADALEFAALERFLKEVDVPPDQVLIEITIAEVTLNDTLKYGVEWYFKNADQTYTFSKTGLVSSVFPGFSFTYTIPDVDVAVNALGSVTEVKVISAPKLLTLNNKAATLQVGDQVPIITQSATGIRDANDPAIVNSVQFRDTGIVLKVTPRISKGGTVVVDVNQEVSSAIPTTTSDIDSPTIQQRKLSSTVAVHDGDSIALGGLIRNTKSYGESGVPVLRDIPLLGALFSNTSDIGDRTELLIFLRPRIIRNAEAAAEMTESLRQGLSGLDVLVNSVHVPRKSTN